MKTMTFILPSHWASALINGDFSGLSGTETECLYAWLRIEQPGICLWCEDEPFFIRCHDAYGVVPQAALCVKYTFQQPNQHD